MDSNKYDELADQLFNLVDNNQSDIDSFYTAQHAPQGQEQQQISQWFDNNVNPDEFDGLLNKDAQQTKDGFINWLTTDGADYFNNDNYVMNNDNINTTETTADNNAEQQTKIADIIQAEDDDIVNDMKTGDYISNNVDNQDEIDAALSVLDDGSDNDDDVDIVFDIVGDDDEFDDAGSEEDLDNDSEELDDPDNTDHRKKIHMDHHVNKVVEKIDDDESIDRLSHKKYYVLKKKELGDNNKLDSLENKLDNQNISYYDFPTTAIKIYYQNEVILNRIFESIGLDVKCWQVAHYTDNWNS